MLNGFTQEKKTHNSLRYIFGHIRERKAKSPFLSTFPERDPIITKKVAFSPLYPHKKNV